MRILSRRPEITDPNATIPAPRRAPRRAPSWPGETVANEDPFWAPIADEIRLQLPTENRNLLVAYPDAPAPGPRGLLAAMALASAVRRSGCRILAASHAAEFEAAVAQNLRIVAETDVTS